VLGSRRVDLVLRWAEAVVRRRRVVWARKRVVAVEERREKCVRGRRRRHSGLPVHLEMDRGRL
jgi:hypothetical protein